MQAVDIRFSCPACGHHIIIDEAGAGMIVECPECGADAPVPKPTPPATQSKDEKDRTVALKWTPPSSSPPHQEPKK
jgi:uncharacterized Zn finger protein